jgi:hypothetical protein
MMKQEAQSTAHHEATQRLQAQLKTTKNSFLTCFLFLRGAKQPAVVIKLFLLHQAI